MRASKARAGLRAGQARPRRWNAYGKHLPFGPEVGAVCGKAARTDLCGGRGVTRVPTATGASSLGFSVRRQLGRSLRQRRMSMSYIEKRAPDLAAHGERLRCTGDLPYRGGQLWGRDARWAQRRARDSYPGPMAEGNWAVAAYIDERADENKILCRAPPQLADACPV
jgi:hypothetical protein